MANIEPRNRYQRLRVQCVVGGPGWESRTQQAHTKDCDINEIMRRCRRGGSLPIRLDANQAAYMDCSHGYDFQEAVNRVATAQLMFDQLPAPVRKEFMNDPGQMVAFCQDPANEDRMRELGLLPEQVELEVVPAQAPTSPVEEPPADGGEA